MLLPDIANNTELLKTGRPLANVAGFETHADLKCPCCGSREVRREIDTLDTFMDSSWYFLRFLEQLDDTLVTAETQKAWMPVDVYVGGMEHAIMHLLYARFVHKFICDWKGIPKSEVMAREPFKELIVQGLVKGKTYRMKEEGRRYLSKEKFEELAKQMGLETAEKMVDVTFEKMSKSKGNGVLPQQVTELHGVDALRSAILFSAPPEHDVNFDFAVVKSMEAYLQRYFRLSQTLFLSRVDLSPTLEKVLESPDGLSDSAR